MRKSRTEVLLHQALNEISMAKTKLSEAESIGLREINYTIHACLQDSFTGSKYTGPNLDLTDNEEAALLSHVETHFEELGHNVIAKAPNKLNIKGRL